MSILEKVKNVLKIFMNGWCRAGKVINNITQNINAGVSYTDVEKIAENVFERKLSKMDIKDEKKDWANPFLL